MCGATEETTEESQTKNKGFTKKFNDSSRKLAEALITFKAYTRIHIYFQGNSS